MKRFLKVAALGVAVAAGSAFAASFTILNQNQVVGVPNIPSLTAGSGQTKYVDTLDLASSTYTTFTLTGGVQGSATRGFQFGGWMDQVDQSPVQITTLGLNTSQVGTGSGIYGWAATFNLAVGGTGSNLRITVQFADNTTAVVAGTGCDALANAGCTTTALNQYGGLFGWGFLSDTAITNVILSADNNSANFEAFGMDDVQLLVAGGSGGNGGNEGGGTVPEPSSFGLMGLAMVGLGVIRKFRK